MNKAYLTSRKNQEKNKTNWRKPFDHVSYSRKRRREGKRCTLKQFLAAPKPVPEVTGGAALYATVDSLTPSEKRLLNLLVFLDSRGVPLFMGHEYLAKKVGCSRRTILRCFDVLEIWGFVRWYRRPRKQNIYKITHIFRREWVQSLLRPLLPVCSSLFLLLLGAYSVTGPFPDKFFEPYQSRRRKNVTLLYNSKEYNNSYNDSSTVIESSEAKVCPFSDANTINSHKGDNVESLPTPENYPETDNMSKPPQQSGVYETKKALEKELMDIAHALQTEVREGRMVLDDFKEKLKEARLAHTKKVDNLERCNEADKTKSPPTE